MVKAANKPIVLIADECYDMSNGLRKACQDVEFRDVSKRSIVLVLRHSCRQEGIFDFLDDVIKHADAETALKQSSDVDETPDELLNWVEDTVPNDFYRDELAASRSPTATGTAGWREHGIEDR